MRSFRVFKAVDKVANSPAARTSKPTHPPGEQTANLCFASPLPAQTTNPDVGSRVFEMPRF
jgi:hypothetical protein